MRIRLINAANFSASLASYSLVVLLALRFSSQSLNPREAPCFGEPLKTESSGALVPGARSNVKAREIPAATGSISESHAIAGIRQFYAGNLDEARSLLSEACVSIPRETMRLSSGLEPSIAYYALRLPYRDIGGN